MATQAKIKINGVVGSNDALALGSTVNLSNSGLGGETTYEWTILSQPTGTQANFVDSGTLVSSSAAPQFIVNKEGSYLLRLIVNKGLFGETQNQVIAAVRELQTGNRIPAAMETTENNAQKGWANTALDEILQRVTRQVDTGVFTCIAGEYLFPGDVVHMTSMDVIAPGLPGMRYIPKVNKALATSLDNVDGPLGIMVGQVNGVLVPVNEDAYCRVMVLGALSSVPLLGPLGSAGAPVYVSDTGAMSLTPGTYIRQVGDVAAVYPGVTPLYDVAIAAVANSIPRGNAGGDLSGYYPDPTIALGAVVEDRIGPLAVTEGKIKDGAVTEAKIGDGAVTEGKIGDGAVTGAKIGSGAVTEGKIGDGAVTGAKIGSGAVTAGKIGDGAVTGAKIGAGAVTADKASAGLSFKTLDSTGTTSSTTIVDIMTLSNVALKGSTLTRINVQPAGAGLYFVADNTNSFNENVSLVIAVSGGPTVRDYEYRYYIPKNTKIFLSPFMLVDVFATGTYTIKLQARCWGAGMTIEYGNITLTAHQL